MKFNFKIQQYQTDAVDAVIKVFNGQVFIFAAYSPDTVRNISIYSQ